MLNTFLQNKKVEKYFLKVIETLKLFIVIMLAF